jgi:hypothetical protein
MRRYLTLSEAKSALNRGKQIEQFLGGYLADGEAAIRYAVIRQEDERIVATIYECLEPPHPDFYDVVEFRDVEPDTDAEDFYFDTLEEAISFLKYRSGASADRYVNQGLVCEEYRDYRKAKNS